MVIISQINSVNHEILELQNIFLEDKYRTNSNWESGLESFRKTITTFKEKNSETPEMSGYINSLDSIINGAVQIHDGIYQGEKKSQKELDKWLYDNFLKRDILDKAIKYYYKMKSTSIDNLALVFYFIISIIKMV